MMHYLSNNNELFFLKTNGISNTQKKREHISVHLLLRS